MCIYVNHQFIRIMSTASTASTASSQTPPGYQTTDEEVMRFIAQLSSKELEVFEVARKCLPMFNVRKCNGFIEWKKTCTKPLE